LQAFFFDLGMLHPMDVFMLHIIAESLEKIPNHIRIEGHTDSVPICTARFPSNWELSTARATSIVHYLLTTHRFEPTRLSAAGYGEFRPIASNNSSEGRSQNRRVDIVILSGKEREREPGQEENPDQVFPTGPPLSGKLTSKIVSPSRDET
jgi:chemotaxis protein MotB